MSRNALPMRFVANEITNVLCEAFELDALPQVEVEHRMLLHSDAVEIAVRWGEAHARAEIPSREFERSLDEFSQRWVVPLVAGMCGRPLLDERGHVVLNPVHDARDAA